MFSPQGIKMVAQPCERETPERTIIPHHHFHSLTKGCCYTGETKPQVLLLLQSPKRRTVHFRLNSSCVSFYKQSVVEFLAVRIKSCVFVGVHRHM